MRLHGLCAEEGFPLPGDRVAVRSTCLCGRPFTAAARTVRKAKRVIRRKYRDHRGQAMAAGPGWVRH